MPWGIPPITPDFLPLLWNTKSQSRCVRPQLPPETIPSPTVKEYGPLRSPLPLQSPLMTRLLISVRSAAEARVALDCGAEIIDVKEPSRGPLGAAELSSLREVVDEIGGQKPISMAAGELLSWDTTRQPQVPHGVSYVKLGLAGCLDAPDWPQAWRRIVENLPGGTAPVGVVYADWPRARSPRPDQVLEAADRLSCPFLLVDTFDKAGGSLLDAWPLEALGHFVGSVRCRRMQLVLAGSLSEATILPVLPLKPDFVGVRGAVCRGGRSGPIEAERISRIARLLGSFPPAPPV